MKSLLRFFVLLFMTSILFTRCELIEHGKDAFLGSYSTDINYDSSKVEVAIDLNADGDLDMTTNPPTTFMPFDSASKVTFIDSYFLESTASILDIGKDSVKYSDNKRILYGCIKGDSVIFKTSTLGDAPPMEGVVIDSTVMNTQGKSISNDVYIDYVFSGTGSVEISPGVIKYGIVRGTVKMIARKK